MKMIILAATLLTSAYAACPNSCNGHGTCNYFDQCTCYSEVGDYEELATDDKMFTGADCSEFTCPRGTSFTRAVSGSSGAHQLEAECSDAGLCNRKTGECTCFAGYEGSACQRTKCPNDCSNHGTCRSNEDFALDFSEAIYSQQNGTQSKDGVYYEFFKVQYLNAWDSGLQYGCLCDAGFRGPDCSQIECPTDFDPMAKETCKQYRGFEASGTAHAGSDPNKFGNTLLVKEYRGAKVQFPYYSPILEYPCNGAPAGVSCSGRGLCDFSTGQCACFQGFTGTACEDVQKLA